MRRRERGFSTAVAGATALACGLTLGMPASAQAAPAPTGLSAQTHAITLVTGDRVLVSEDGTGPTASVQPAAGTSGGFLTQRLGEELYVIPVAALPFLGKSLDRSLFDVSALVRDGLDGARTPVEMSFVDKPVAVPGVTAGAVTAPAAFGAALAAQPGAGPLFGGVSSIRLAAAGATPQASPRFPMHTVTIHATSPDGKPASASLGVVNTDDSRKYGGFPQAVDGEARISVPDGNYGVAAFFTEGDPGAPAKAVRAVTAGFTVAGQDTAVTIDARTATSQVTIDVPRPATEISSVVNLILGDAAQGSLGAGFINFGSTPTYVTPVTTAPAGALHFNVSSHRESPAGTANPYVYDVKVDNTGTIPADQHHVVTSGQLATVQEHYYSDKPDRHESSSRILSLPYEFGGFGVFGPAFSAPQVRTEYVGGAPGLKASMAVVAGWDTFGGFSVSSSRSYPPRKTTSEDWLRGPLAPGLRTPLDPQAPWFCEACRMDDTIDLAVAPALDSGGNEVSLDRPGPDVVSTSHFRLTTGDTVLADTDDITGAEVTVPPQRAGYRLSYDQTRTAPWFHQSTVSHTEWTFTSQHSGTQTVPATFGCGFFGPAENCSALSLLTAKYKLDTRLDGTIPAGPASLAVTFGHSPGAKDLPIRRANVEVSFDGGAHWQRTWLADTGHGQYRAFWLNPRAAKATDVALRVSATDVAGASISQSVTAAYTVPQS